MPTAIAVKVLRRRTTSPFPGEGYRRAKRSLRPWPLKVGAQVVYEDRQGRVHHWTFQIISLTRTSAIIKGWPDGVLHKGRMKRLAVMRSALVDVCHVRDEEFKAAFDVPEDSKCVRYDYFLFGVQEKRRTRREEKKR